MQYAASPLLIPTVDQLGRLGAARPEVWQPLLAEHGGAALINTARRWAAFLANTLHETAGFVLLVENLSYRADRIARVWPGRFPTVADAQPFARNPEALAERVYRGRMGNIRPGDGFRYRGRGLMQTTGRHNYARLLIVTGRNVLAHPEWLETPPGAAESACLFWASRSCNGPADADDIDEVRRRINGGLIGIDNVRARYARALKLFGAD